jgi:hypothetical protein
VGAPAHAVLTLVLAGRPRGCCVARIISVTEWTWMMCMRCSCSSRLYSSVPCPIKVRLETHRVQVHGRRGGGPGGGNHLGWRASPWFWCWLGAMALGLAWCLVGDASWQRPVCRLGGALFPVREAERSCRWETLAWFTGPRRRRPWTSSSS